MKIEHMGSRSTAITFEDDISIFLIQGNQYTIICDTHLGPRSMDGVKTYIAQGGLKNEVILFNSHSDWDHIWGNCAFPDAKIIAHDSSRKRLKEIGKYELNQHVEFHKGEIKIKLPNLTFSDKLSLSEENIHFIYAPGHTVDSAVCFDQKDSCLFVGDLVEDPIPYLDFYDLEAYIQSLEWIKSFPAKNILSAHSYVVDLTLIDQNISYLESVLQDIPLNFELNESYRKVHQFNLNNRLLLQHEPIIREMLGRDFNYEAYKRNFSNIENMKTEEFKYYLDDYLNSIRK